MVYLLLLAEQTNDSVDIDDNLIVGGIGTITGAATLSSTLGVAGVPLLI